MVEALRSEAVRKGALRSGRAENNDGWAVSLKGAQQKPKAVGLKGATKSHKRIR